LTKTACDVLSFFKWFKVQIVWAVTPNSELKPERPGLAANIMA
jgi:hypothetical protein